MMLFCKKMCPLCRDKRAAASLRLAGGEAICPDCEKLLRGSYDLEKKGFAFCDTLQELDFSLAKQMVDELKAEQRKAILRFRHAYAGIISVLKVYSVPAAELKKCGSEPDMQNKISVVLGFCAYGVFSEGERVRIIGRKNETEATVLKLIPCTESNSFFDELTEGSHKTECLQNNKAWLVLDCSPKSIGVHDRIAVCPIRPI